MCHFAYFFQKKNARACVYKKVFVILQADCGVCVIHIILSRDFKTKQIK